MKFYGREEEIGILRRERELSHRQSRFTVVTGRRRVGKTELIGRALNDGTDDYLYLLFLVCESPAVRKRQSALTFFEVKRDAARIDFKALEAKVAAFFEKHPELKNGEPKIKGLSLEDM